MLRVNTKPRKRNSPRIAEKSAEAFKQWLRGRDCVFKGVGECGGKTEAMHLDFAGGKGVGTKVADRYCLPSCAVHHGWQHIWGWNTFCIRMGTTKDALLAHSGTLWRAWPGRIAWERKLADGTLPKRPSLTEKDYRGA